VYFDRRLRGLAVSWGETYTCRRRMAVNRPLPTRLLLSAALCVAAAFVVFHFFGNATRGYIATRSLFVWWGSQWLDARSESQHAPLVLLVAGWLWWRNFRRARIQFAHGDGVVGRRDALVSAAILCVALALHALGYASQQTRLSIVALYVFLAGILRLLGGREALRAAYFPLAFALLASPLGFLDDLGFYLRLAVSATAESVARACGVPIVRNGTQLFSTDGQFQYDVAAACSGIRSLVALFALGLVIAYLNFRAWWSRAALALLTFPFAFIGNALRILAIVFVGEKWGHQVGACLHNDASGLLVFAIVLALLLGCVKLFRRRGRDDSTIVAAASENSSAAQPSPAGAASPWLVIAPVLATSVLVIWTARRLDTRPPVNTAGVVLAANAVDPAPLPEFLGTEWIGQRVDVTAVERETLPPDTGYSRRNYVSVQDRARQVFFSIVLSGKDRTSIHRPELCIAGQGWTVRARTTHEFFLADGSRVPATLLRLEREVTDRHGKPVTVKTLLAYWFASRASVVASHRGMLVRNAVDRVTRLRGDRWAYVVSQSLIFKDDEAAALAAMTEVTREVWPQVRAAPQ
jgi:exosortase